MSLTDDALEQVGRLFKENAELRERVEQVAAQRDEWHRQNGLLRGERDAAKTRAEQAEEARRTSLAERDEWRRAFDAEHIRAEQAEAALAARRQEHRAAYFVVMEERDDARNRLRAETAVAKELLQRNVELGTRADNAEAALAELRERLGNLEPAGMQYRANGPHVHGVSEGNVRDYFLNQWVEGYWPEGRQLYAGPWQRIEELRDDATPPTALERVADEQGEREGHGPNALGGRCRNDTSGNSRA